MTGEYWPNGQHRVQPLTFLHDSTVQFLL